MEYQKEMEAEEARDLEHIFGKSMSRKRQAIAHDRDDL